MPRYIDAETALKIIDSYAKTVSEDGKTVVEAIRDIVEIITPTADVAPRAEVEELQAECNKWQERLKNECEYTEAITKKKVAREIFEELDKVYDECIDVNPFTNIGSLQVIKFEQMLAELKKKYTEDKL